MTNTIVFLTFITIFLHCAATLTCPPGTHVDIYNEKEICIECPDGTFMPDSDHQKTNCRPCDEIRDPDKEVLISACNKSYDAVIHCVEGHYRDLARNPREINKCMKCTECQFTGRPCDTYRDAICCWDENYDVIPNHHGVLVCKERPWFCRRGQYFDTRGYQCLPCPNNTYMPLEYHINPECWKCREFDKYESYRPLHSAIIHPCNSTHEASIRCEEGFFMKPNMGYRQDSLGCSPCTDCSRTDAQYEGRKCDSMRNTVCCPRPNMTVVDTPDGPVCTAVSDDCKAEQCLLYHAKNGSLECSSCLPGTGSHQEESTNYPQNINDKEESLTPEKDAALERTASPHSSLGLVCGLFVAGVAVGIVVTLVFIVLSRKYFKQHPVAMWVSSKILTFTGKPGDLDKDEKEAQVPLRPGVEAIPMEETPLRRPRAYSLPDCGELEQTFGNEADMKARKKACKRFPGHIGFISGEDFVSETLPQKFRYERNLAYIKAVCNLTVRVRVSEVSKERLDDDPYQTFRGPQGLGLRRYGNGLVFHVSKEYGADNSEKCPCKDCLAFPEYALKSWAEFLVVTSAQIVFDEIECDQTSCKLWYDHDEDPFQSPSLKGWKVKKIDRDLDVCIIRCVSHDKELTEKLEKQVSLLNTLRALNKEAGDDIGEVERQAVMILHPHSLSKRISQISATTKTKGKQIRKWTYGAYSCPGSIGAPVCLLSKTKGRKILTTIYNGKRASRGFDLDVDCAYNAPIA